jgi:hypothetical protein
MRYEVYEITDDGRQLLLRTDSYDDAWNWASGPNDLILDTVSHTWV